MGNLYIVSTPIGNLEDVTLRAIRILREVSLIAAEDTRKTKRLLGKYEIRTPLTSYYEHSRITKLNNILEKLKDGDVALVSEAGTPGINDPGYELIKEAISHGIPVIPIPGATAVTTALVVSGLPVDRFLYTGFLPNKSGDRKKTLESLKSETATLIILEAPHRLKGSLRDILNTLGDRRIAVCRELTKIHEEVFRGTVKQAAEKFISPRGEFVLVLEGNCEKVPAGVLPDTDSIDSDLRRQLIILHKKGFRAGEAVARLAQETGISRKRLYSLWLEAKQDK
jgi:16S rRNA (cytidine1402-2'-O)-methyltransferase